VVVGRYQLPGVLLHVPRKQDKGFQPPGLRSAPLYHEADVEEPSEQALFWMSRHLLNKLETKLDEQIPSLKAVKKQTDIRNNVNSIC
jgi:hypothetical protein